MRRLPILVTALLLCLLVDPALAEIYQWTDQTGRVHFTQDLSKIPARYRRQAGEQAAKRSTSKSPVQSYSSQPPASRQSSSSQSGRWLPAQAPCSRLPCQWGTLSRWTPCASARRATRMRTT